MHYSTQRAKFSALECLSLKATLITLMLIVCIDYFQLEVLVRLIYGLNNKAGVNGVLAAFVRVMIYALYNWLSIKGEMLA